MQEGGTARVPGGSRIADTLSEGALRPGHHFLLVSHRSIGFESDYL